MGSSWMGYTLCPCLMCTATQGPRSMQTKMCPFTKDPLARPGILNQVWIAGVFKKKLSAYPQGLPCLHFNANSTRKQSGLTVNSGAWQNHAHSAPSGPNPARRYAPKCLGSPLHFEHLHSPGTC